MKTKIQIFIFSIVILLTISCGGGNNAKEFDYYKEAYEKGKEIGFTCSTQMLCDSYRDAANGWWVNYFHFQPPTTPEEKENFQKFEEGWNAGLDDGFNAR